MGNALQGAAVDEAEMEDIVAMTLALVSTELTNQALPGERKVSGVWYGDVSIPR